MIRTALADSGDDVRAAVDILIEWYRALDRCGPTYQAALDELRDVEATLTEPPSALRAAEEAAEEAGDENRAMAMLLERLDEREHPSLAQAIRNELATGLHRAFAKIIWSELVRWVATRRPT